MVCPAASRITSSAASRLVRLSRVSRGAYIVHGLLQHGEPNGPAGMSVLPGINQEGVSRRETAVTIRDGIGVQVPPGIAGIVKIISPVKEPLKLEQIGLHADDPAERRR